MLLKKEAILRLSEVNINCIYFLINMLAPSFKKRLRFLDTWLNLLLYLDLTFRCFLLVECALYRWSFDILQVTQEYDFPPIEF